jgi:hypothetical protein
VVGGLGIGVYWHPGRGQDIRCSIIHTTARSSSRMMQLRFAASSLQSGSQDRKKAYCFQHITTHSICCWRIIALALRAEDVHYYTISPRCLYRSMQRDKVPFLGCVNLTEREHK